MKKSILIKGLLLSALSVAMFTSCNNEEDDIWNKSAAERLNESVSIFKSRFASSPGGWVMEYYPTNATTSPTGCGYLILADIKADGSVRMAMCNDLTGGAYREDDSEWEIIKDTGPVISFSTYNNCIHTFCDPGLYDLGNGYGGDYEFVIIDMEEDAQIGFIKGKKSGAYVRMIRLLEGTDYRAYLDEVIAFQDKYFPVGAPNKLVLNLNGEKKYVDEVSTTIPNIYPVGGDPINDEYRAPFIVSKRDGKMFLRFRIALNVKESDGGVQEFVWDDANGIFNGVDNTTCTLGGEMPAEFLYNTATTYGHWQWSTSSDASESVKAILSNISAQFKEISTSKQKYTFNNMQLKSVNQQLQLVVNYKFNNATSSAAYIIDGEMLPNGNLNLTYREPLTDAASKFMDFIPAIGDMVNMLCGELRITSNGNNLVLDQLKVSPVANGDDWLTISLN